MGEAVMIQFLLLLVVVYCSATSNRSLGRSNIALPELFVRMRRLGYDFGQYYSRIRVFEYTDYSDVKLLKFNIDAPTASARWSVNFDTEGKCGDGPVKFHL